MFWVGYIDDINDEVSNFKGDNIVTVSVLEDDLEEVVRKFKEGEQNHTLNVTAISGTVGGLPKSIPVFKWNIFFDGTPASGSVNAFLQRIEELRLARNCSKEELFQSAADIFRGIGLEWYRSQLRRNRFDSWDNLVLALRKDFLPVDYDDHLKSEILKRTQGANEKVVIFVSIMENLFNCLSDPPPEAERLKIIKKNLLPSYQKHLALQTINNLTDLCNICRALEEAELIQSKFVPPPRRNVCTLEPGLSYEGDIRDQPSTSSDNFCCSHNNNFTQKCSNQNYPRNRRTNNAIKQVSEISCFGCNQPGHIIKNSRRQNREPVCHGCGSRGVIRPNCRNCNAKNVSKGNPK